MILKPRKRIDPNRIEQGRPKPVPAYCAFCRAPIARAPRWRGPTDLRGTRCIVCDALWIADPTGKQGGEALMFALHLMANGNDDSALQLREGEHYEARVLAWNESSNEVDDAADATRYGVGRLWFFRMHTLPEG